MWLEVRVETHGRWERRRRRRHIALARICGGDPSLLVTAKGPMSTALRLVARHVLHGTEPLTVTRSSAALWAEPAPRGAAAQRLPLHGVVRPRGAGMAMQGISRPARPRAVRRYGRFQPVWKRERSGRGTPSPARRCSARMALLLPVPVLEQFRLNALVPGQPA